MTGQCMRLTGAFAVGVASLLVALMLLALFFTDIISFFFVIFPFFVGAVLLLTAIVILWVLIYFSTMIVVGVYYAIRHPMRVNEMHDAHYGVSGVKEAGRRAKGKSLKAPVHPSKKAEHAARKAAKRRAAKKKR